MNNNETILGFYTYSDEYPDEFLIGEYFPDGSCTGEFRLVRTVYGFQAQIFDDAFKLVLNPKLEKLWGMTKSIDNMRDMELYLINIGLIKCN